MARATGRQAVACDRAGERRTKSTSVSESKRSNGMARAKALSIAESNKPLFPSLEKITELFSRLKLVDPSEAQVQVQVQIPPSADPLPSKRKLDRDGTRFRELKKYKRTAEGDPDLIRPLPVLMQDMDYLLGLLDEPYSDRFLGLYNYMWDRMRAIRMDLRIQHISNPEAVSMLEQMIRLHIIAVHELCEHGKGKGSPEGFDAHLNVEQMNKAFAELFQMYEDHRRKGMPFSSEREFRAYYALLKLGSHPGHKVEPAELSLDLARLSGEVRRSPEIAFVRDVAKACGSGNYVSFFRLAKKASYLQACLMHPHFWKVRNEALASLHTSFRSNQGMQLARLEDMLAMAGEDVKSFAEDRGFVLKCFEELYIVKGGSFVRREHPPSRWSPLVGMKRSHKMKLDVYFSPGPNTAVGANTEAKELDEQVSDKATGAKRGAQEVEEPSNKSVGVKTVAQELDEHASNKAAGVSCGAQELEWSSNKVAGANRGSQEVEEPSNKAVGAKTEAENLDEQASNEAAEANRGAQNLKEPSNKADGADIGVQESKEPSNKSVGGKTETQESDKQASNEAAGANRGAQVVEEPSNKADGAYKGAQGLEEPSVKSVGGKTEGQESDGPPLIGTDLVPPISNKEEVEEFLEKIKLCREAWLEKEVEISHQKFLILYDKVNKVQEDIDKILYIYF